MPRLFARGSDGVVCIHTGSDDVVADPTLDLSRVLFHSSLLYPSLTQTITTTITLPNRALGSASLTMAPVMADVLRRRGVRALVVRGEDGLDEISTCAPTRVWDGTAGDAVVEGLLDVTELGVPRIEPALLRGGDA